jgi:hypothetical protein
MRDSIGTTVELVVSLMPFIAKPASVMHRTKSFTDWMFEVTFGN